MIQDLWVSRVSMATKAERGSCHNKLLYCTSAWGKIWRAPCTGKAETAETGVEGDAIGKRGDHVAVGQFGLQCSTTGDGK